MEPLGPNFWHERKTFSRPTLNAIREVKVEVGRYVDAHFDDFPEPPSDKERLRFRDELQAHAFAGLVIMFDSEMPTFNEIWDVWEQVRGDQGSLESGGLRGPRKGNGRESFPVLRPVWRDFQARFDPIKPNARRLGCKEPALAAFSWRLGCFSPKNLSGLRPIVRTALVKHPSLKGELASEKTQTELVRPSQSLS